MERFLGKWEVTTTENMDKLLDGIDMDDDKKAMYTDLKTILEYTSDGTTWQAVVHLPDGSTRSYKFHPGVEFSSSTLDGRPITSQINVVGDRFEEVHRDQADPTLDAKIIKEIVGDELVVTAEVRGITSITRHVRISP